MSTEHLLQRLMSRSTPEDILTESLAYILRNSTPFRQFMADHVCIGTGPEDEYEIETQQGFGGGRADIMWKAPKWTCILESKIWAWWNQEQPDRYIRELQKGSGDSVFGLIAPSSRLTGLREDAVRRLRKDFTSISWDGGIGKADQTRIVSFSWRDIGDWLRKAVVEEDDHRTKLHMEELISVTDEIDPRFESKPERLSVDGLGAALRDLCRVVVNIRSRLESDDIEVNRISSGDEAGWYYGFCLSPASETIKVWFGVWIGPWASERVGPLWLSADEREAARWLRVRVRGAIDYSDSCVAPVVLEGGTWEEVQAKVTERLLGIINAPQEPR
jgi:hypothetical protein